MAMLTISCAMTKEAVHREGKFYEGEHTIYVYDTVDGAWDQVISGGTFRHGKFDGLVELGWFTDSTGEYGAIRIPVGAKL